MNKTKQQIVMKKILDMLPALYEILIRQKELRVGFSAYRDICHVTLTTVIVERLFGKAKHILTAALRRKMDP